MSTQQLIVDNSFYDMCSINDAVDRWLNGIGGEDAFLIYIHGKGKKEPGKTQELLPDLIKLYDVWPLVLHWQPSQGLWPDDGAEAAGAALVTLLQNLMARRTPAKPIVLLGQSMGNFAIQEVGISVRNGRLRLPASLLATIVLSAPAVKAKNHHEWLGPLSQKADTYVVVNEHDNLLQAANLLGKQPLGHSLNDIVLANEVIYVDISKLGREFHRYYRPDNGQVPKNMKEFYSKVLRGLTPDLSGFSLVRNQVRELD